MRTERPHWGWIVLLILGNVVAWIAFFQLNGAVLDAKDLPSTRLSVFGALLLLDNLVVLWWYARLTQTLAKAAQAQLVLSDGEAKAQLAERIQANKPIVVLVKELLPAPEAARYMFRNVARGTAINVWYVDTTKPVWTPHSIGALAPESVRFLSDEIERPFRDAGGIFTPIVVAEGIPTRTTRWTLRAN